ncbi:hypothetical protein SISNIDRAFT_453069 [Sistotremastrum niveocremeum HHB9708]|uniref:Uncharacterized protein n=1 Tax=Sistotremastrum niveocremeum HHB9708 TaxID=1314777 RepID=A0A164WBM4_9AGAM|nr:hypothetical protein SISNIDRAFT_453069 [Sistotremastrum niveocremeum HHB9708]
MLLERLNLGTPELLLRYKVCPGEDQRQFQPPKDEAIVGQCSVICLHFRIPSALSSRDSSETERFVSDADSNKRPRLYDITYESWGTFEEFFWRASKSSEPLHAGRYANILYFSVLLRPEFESIRRRWSQNDRKSSTHAILLVGLDARSRSDPEVVHRLFSTGEKEGPVLPEEGERLGLEIGASKYMECSMDDEEQVVQLLQEAYRISSNPWSLRNKLADCVLQ